MASRHLSRALVLQTLFEADMMKTLEAEKLRKILRRNSGEYALGPSDVQFAEELLAGITAKRDEIDAVIVKAAPQWPLENVAPIDRNVLRIGLYELLFGDRRSVPPKVALNEAIEIAKAFGGEQSGKFVNGVLGAVYRDIGEPMKEDGNVTKQNPTEALAGAVVIAEGERRVALVLDAFHRWTLPKARLEPGEISEMGAKRAIMNELGVSADIVEPIGEHAYTAHDPSLGTVERSVAYFLARAPKDAALKCTVCEGVTDARWFQHEELATTPLYEDLRAIIEKGFERANAL